MDKAREAAVFALERFRREKAWSAAITDGAITKYGLDPRSAALASNICLGVLQNLAYCDHYIDLFSSSPAKIEPKVRDILRCAVYQLLFMDKIPANAPNALLPRTLPGTTIRKTERIEISHGKTHCACRRPWRF